jgi:hypothetical protein
MHRHFDELTIRGVGARADRTAVEQPAAAHRAPGGNPRQRPRVANRSSRTSATPPVAASSVRSRRYPEPQPEPAQSRASGHAVIPGHAMIPGQGLDGPWPTAALHDTLPPFSRTTGAHEPAPLPPQRPSRFTLTGPPRTSASSMRQMLDHSSSNRAARQEGDGRTRAEMAAFMRALAEVERLGPRLHQLPRNRLMQIQSILCAGVRAPGQDTYLLPPVQGMERSWPAATSDTPAAGGEAAEPVGPACWKCSLGSAAARHPYLLGRAQLASGGGALHRDFAPLHASRG